MGGWGGGSLGRARLVGGAMGGGGRGGVGCMAQ